MCKEGVDSRSVLIPRKGVERREARLRAHNTSVDQRGLIRGNPQRIGEQVPVPSVNALRWHFLGNMHDFDRTSQSECFEDILRKGPRRSQNIHHVQLSQL